MLNRTSKVKFLKLQFVGAGSTLQIGDSEELFFREKVLAIQRYLADYLGNEGSFKQEDYQLFQQPVPQPLPETGVCSAFFHENPVIRVRAIKIQSVSSSSTAHIGSTRSIDTDTRIKHIRNLPPRNSQ
ncbi:spore germination protein GerPE [Bacillus sonorensis]|uniref:Spore germination protein n=2 Tax=Bacillus sonorensis TaxID=119858 RepID=M5PF10_9BACI|nr:MULTISPECIES: spore germination protein GerPE [Bacillus]TWK72783.1 putative spore germination protein GerPE [Bacillus paralicheniformis]ASB90183.1 putative spore germination protein GerPE [Bacillus sonorensis]EME76045.1 spore germination protein [Bacillus sonorensis L12]MBG9916621.1 spore gernimation protein GerPE [Bacillus sonorensis]MCF7619424.1 spore germination protein GerPE [Bacillus sonorensis]